MSVEKLRVTKTGALVHQDKSRGVPAYCLGGVRHKGGMTLIKALEWNVGNLSFR
jgi:hypothetical protein